MPEAVIVSAARSPIGRANKGSLKDLRPDDLAAHDRAGGAGQGPGARPQRHRRPLPRLRTARRRVGLQHGPHRHRPATASTTCPAPPSPATAPRRCRPPGWRSTRSRPARATCSSRPASRRCRGSSRAPPTTCPTPRTRSSPTPRPAPKKTAEGGVGWHDPREDGLLPDAYIAMGQTAENVAKLRGLPARSSTSSASGRRTSPRRRSPTASGPARSPRSPPPTAPSSAADDGPRAGVTYEADLAAQAGLPPRRRRHRRQLLPAQRRRRRGRDHVRHQGRRARPHPAGPHRLHRRHRPLPRDHGPRPGRGHQARARATPA